MEGYASASLKQIKALTPPGSMRTETNQWIGSLARAQADMRNAVAALRSGDYAQVRSDAREGAVLNKRDHALARSLGLPRCAADPQQSGAG